jgi:hypothetical protein
MKYFVIFLILIGLIGLIISNAYAELDKSILEPFKNNDLVIIGKIIQVNTIVSENKTEYNIQVEEYLKNQKSFEMITAILDGVRSPDFPSYPMDFPNSNPLDYYNKPYFEEGNQVLAYLKQEGGIYKMSPYSFTIEKKDVAGPPIVILPTGPQEHYFSQGVEIVISGVIKKGYMYELGQTDKDSSLNLVILNEKGESIVSKKLTVNVDGSYQFPFQMKGDLHVPGKYSWEIQFGHDTMGGEFVIEPNLELLSPLKQIQLGIYGNDILCRDDRVLVLKKSKELYSCIKPQTVPKLFARNWALNEVEIIDTDTAEQDSKLIKITGVVNRLTTPEGFEYHLIPLQQELPRIDYTGYDTLNLFATKDTIHHFLRNLNGKLVTIEGNFLLENGKYFRHYSGFPTIPVTKLDVVSEKEDLKYSIEGATLLSVTKIPETIGINIVLQETQKGTIEITIPRDLIDTKIGQDDDSFLVLIDGYEVPYIEVKNDLERTLTIGFEEGARIIQVIGFIPI